MRDETHDIAIGNPLGDHRELVWLCRNTDERQDVLVPEPCPSDHLLDKALGNQVSIGSAKRKPPCSHLVHVVWHFHAARL